MSKLAEHIVKVKGGFRLLSHRGKNLGTYGSRAGAVHREKQVEYFKTHKEHVELKTLRDFLK